MKDSQIQTDGQGASSVQRLVRRFCALSVFWPIGGRWLKRQGWTPFTARPKRRWWYAGYWEEPNEGIGLYPYRDAMMRELESPTEESSDAREGGK